MNKVPENDFTRLASLDILRGFDLFLLVFFQPVFVALARQLNLPFLDEVLYQFDHEVWEGFRFWDLVMPLFLFMTGASMPFSLSKYKTASVHQDGLVHISQMTDRYIKHPLEAVSVGDVVDVKVLAVDLDKKRISLTMKGLK